MMQLLHPNAARRVLRRGFVAVLALAAACGGGDGGTDVQAPVITTLDPGTVVMYDVDFTLTVNGSGFAPESVVQWMDVDRPTTFVSETQLTAYISSEDLEQRGHVQVSVFDRRTGVRSNWKDLVVRAPVPVVTLLAPERVVTGNGPVLLRVLGEGFAPGSLVRRDGIGRPTTFVSRNELNSEIPAAEQLAGRTIVVTVSTGDPGGGLSNNAHLPVQAPPNPIPVPTSLSPAAVLAGTGGTITVRGTGFIPSTRVEVRGVFPRPAVTVVSSTELRFTLTPDNVPEAGSWEVTLTNFDPGGGTGPPILLRVENPAPVITALSPAQAVAGQQDMVVRITGTGFVRNTFIHFGDQAQGSGFVNPTTLQFVLRGVHLQQAGTFPITVSTVGPGGGVSNAFPFTVVNPPAN